MACRWHRNTVVVALDSSAEGAAAEEVAAADAVENDAVAAEDIVDGVADGNPALVSAHSHHLHCNILRYYHHSDRSFPPMQQLGHSLAIRS